jgi:uncharacterized protein
VRIVAAVLIGIVAAVAILWLLQRRLIYLPTAVMPEVVHVLDGAEEVAFETADGLELRAWFVPAMTDDLDVAVIVLPGNAGNRALRTPLARALAQRGADVLLVDYRGYGGNPGRPSEQGLVLDAHAARDYLAGRADVDTGRIVYFGESLGAAVAVGLAAETPPAALVLRSPFTSLADVAAIHYRFLPVRLLLWDRFPAIEQIPDVAAPILVVAGEGDRIVPIRLSRELYEAAADPKSFVAIPSVGHNDPELNDGEQVIEETIAFIVEHVGH